MKEVEARLVHLQKGVIQRPKNSEILMNMMEAPEFQSIIWDFYTKNKREFLWRQQINPYYVVISEIMLQQTQTFRVVPKFEYWIAQFPTFDALAQAPSAQVIAAWQGLGYNRRALAIHALAKRVMQEFNGIVPADPDILCTFSGIGKATAASICAFAFNMPTIFIETNIRAVFIYFYFQQQEVVADKEIIPLVQQTLDKKNPREWYYALMDYGSWLKKMYNPNKKSKHYTIQSPFEGSFRQIRSTLLRLILECGPLQLADLYAKIPYDTTLICKALDQLEKEGFVKKENSLLSIK